MYQEGISVDQIVAIIIVLLILIVFFLIVLGNIKKLKKGVNKTNESSENTKAKLEDLDQEIRRMNVNNQEVIKVHRQIKEKSEAMNKMLKQTNRIYKEVLDKKSEFDTQDKDFIKIDYDKLNKPLEKEESKDHLTQLLKNINSDKEQISNKITPEPKKVIRPSIKQLTQIDIENIKRMDLKELEALFLTLKDYKIILNKEVDYYIEQIEQINRHKGSITPSQRLGKKELIYKDIKEVEEKIDYQQTLLEAVKRKMEELQLEEQTYEKEKEIDQLINNIVKKR